MATEDSTDRFYFERCVISEDSDSEYGYDWVAEDDGTQSVVDQHENLEKTIQVIEKSSREACDEISLPTSDLPSVICKPELVEDFVRNFLVIKKMQKTLDAFQNEWYELQENGLNNNENHQYVDDAYSSNLFLIQELEQARSEADNFRKLALRSKERFSKVLRERDFHKMNHRRLMQEKEKLLKDLNRMKENLCRYEPTVNEIAAKYRTAMKEKMLATLELEKTKIQLECSKNSQKNPYSPKKLEEFNNVVTNFNCSYDNMKENNNNNNYNAGPKSYSMDSKFPKDTKYNPRLAKVKLPAQFITRTGGFEKSNSFVAHSFAVTSIKMHPCEMTLATTSDDGTWKLWNSKSYDLIVTGQGHSDWVADCDFSPCGTKLVTCSGDTTLKIWDTESASCLHTFVDHLKAVWSCSWHYGGNFLATSSLDNTSKLWDLNSLRCRYTLRGHRDSVNSIEFLDYSNILATCSADSTICLWDARSNTPKATYTGHKHSVNHCKFNLRGNMLVSCDSAGYVKTWDIRTNKAATQLRCGVSSANMACFDPTGSLAVVASNDGIVRVIDLSSGSIKNMDGHKNSVQCIYYDLSGEFILSGASDNVVTVWS